MEPTRIVNESSYNFRAMARAALANKWTTAAIAAFIVTALVSVPSAVIDGLFGIEIQPFNDPSLQEALREAGMDPNTIELSYKVSPISGVYLFLMSGPFAYGAFAFFSKLFRRGEMDLEDTFAGFSQFGRMVIMFLCTLLLTVLWALIPIAGPVLAVIAAFRYSQCYLVAMDHPEMSPIDCVRESTRIMKGNKVKYFCLNLSFIGWFLLAALAAGLVGGIFGMIGTGWILDVFVSILSAIALAPVWAYNYTARIGFYDMLTGKIPGDVYIQQPEYTGR